MSKLKTILLLLIPVCLAFFQVVLGDKMLKWDILDISLPWRYFISECIENKTLPFWNPFLNLGFPQGGDPQTWYPISALISTVFGYTINVLHFEFILHLVVGALGFRFLAKKVFHLEDWQGNIGALCYACSGFMVGNAQHLGWIVSAAWIPWILSYTFLFVKKYNLRNLSGLVISLFFLLTGGYPGLFIVTCYLIVAFYLYVTLSDRQFRLQSILWPILGTVLFLMMSSIVLASSFEIREEIYRNVLSPEQVTYGSISLSSLRSLFSPLSVAFNAKQIGSGLSVSNSYFGFIPLCLMLLAVPKFKKQDWVLFSLGVLFFLTAVGEDLPIRRWLYVLPFFDTFRFPAIFRLYGILSFLILAIKHIPNIQVRLTKRNILIASATCAVLSFFLFSPNLVLDTFVSEGYQGLSKLNTYSLIGIQMFVFSIIGLIFYGLLQTKLSFHLVLYVVIALDCITSVQLNGPSTVYLEKPSRFDAEQKLSRLPQGWPIPDLSIAMLDTKDHQVEKVNGLWRNMNCFYKKPSFYGYSPYYLNTTSKLEANSRADSILQHPLFCVFDTLATDSILGKIVDSEITIASFSPTKVELNVTSEKSGVLLYQQNNYPGWKVFIDQKPAKIRIANYCQISVPLKKGIQQVSFVFEPKHKAWFYVSLISLIITLCLFFWVKKIN